MPNKKPSYKNIVPKVTTSKNKNKNKPKDNHQNQKKKTLKKPQSASKHTLREIMEQIKHAKPCEK